MSGDRKEFTWDLSDSIMRTFFSDMTPPQKDIVSFLIDQRLPHLVKEIQDVPNLPKLTHTDLLHLCATKTTDVATLQYFVE